MTFYPIAEDCLDRHAESPKTKGKTALLFIDAKGKAESWSYEALSLATNRMARALAGAHFRAGARLILQLPNGPDFPIVFLGTMKLGAVPIPVSPMATPSELDFLRRDSGAKIVVTTASPLLRNYRRFPTDFKSKKTSPNDPAFWLYTSGTEGRPKAVIHAHRSLPAHDARSRVWMKLRRDDVVFNTSALNWSYALTTGLLDVWRRGATSVVSAAGLDPATIGKIISEHKVSVFMSVPGIYRRLVQAPRRIFKSVRVCLSAGEKLSSEAREAFRRSTGLAIYEGLGMTEHSVYLVQRFGERLVPGSCGKPVPGTRIAILRDDLTQARPGEAGILASHRSCPGLMLGYYRRPGEQRRCFRREWFLSGDLAYRDARNNYFYLGRRDDVITAGGYRISPLEVEAAVNRHPSVLESAAVGKVLEGGKTIVACYVVTSEKQKEGERLAQDILRFAGERLARYKVPRKVVFVARLPKTKNGKIRRNELSC